MICPKCGAQNLHTACEYCGYDIVSEVSKDGEGRTVVINNVYTQRRTYSNSSPKSKWSAFFLCLLFGYFGVHRFYVRKFGTAILYLLTFGVFGFGYIIDLIRILVGSFTDNNGLKLIN